MPKITRTQPAGTENLTYGTEDFPAHVNDDGGAPQLMPKLRKFLQHLANVDTAITTLLITNLISVAALWLLFKIYCQPNQMEWSKFSEVLKNFIEVAAILTAAIWTYYLFIRGRLHMERLELVLKGRSVTIDNRQYLIYGT